MDVRMVKESGKDLSMQPWSEKHSCLLRKHATAPTALCEWRRQLIVILATELSNMGRGKPKPILSTILYGEYRFVCIQTVTSHAIASSGFMERVNTRKGTS
jgi:hypothetical protein